MVSWEKRKENKRVLYGFFRFCHTEVFDRLGDDELIWDKDDYFFVDESSMGEGYLLDFSLVSLHADRIPDLEVLGEYEREASEKVSDEFLAREREEDSSDSGPSYERSHIDPERSEYEEGSDDPDRDRDRPVDEREDLFGESIIADSGSWALGDDKIEYQTRYVRRDEDREDGESLLDEWHISVDIVSIECVVRHEREQGSGVGAADDEEEYDGEDDFEAHSFWDKNRINISPERFLCREKHTWFSRKILFLQIDLIFWEKPIKCARLKNMDR